MELWNLMAPTTPMAFDPEIAKALIAALSTIFVAALGLTGVIFGKVHEGRHQSTVKTVEDAGERLRKQKNLEIHQLKVASKAKDVRITQLETMESYLKDQLAECLRRQPG